ncbi:alpha/beta fold hydrolase [Flavobacterium hungaricum]|uniref:Alpha/beta hydrolase n=1 Tax=Flavobacterium hungaricum TaxID=2082725 RepID=A0ABR9TGD3_9FLAO|nr:alpha/beta hydrolase [Flavobacterium hungaricum]MBE8724394.1 alpha/beta hydrolase [Flavobacterium hungaricum]
MKNDVYYKTLKINGLDIFYRQAGSPEKPTLLLLHGFPSSSHMFRNLIDLLSDSFYLIAPDYPGFGQSSAPRTNEFEYTFHNLSVIIEAFIEELGLQKINFYIQDYGGPIAFRIASRRPEWVNSFIIQNANAYLEGLGEALAPLAAYIESDSEEAEQGARTFLQLEATKWTYLDGASEPEKISPDSYSLDQFYLDRPGNDLIQLALFRDYGSNIALYPDWQQYLKTQQPKAVIIWGSNDKMFVKAGGQAYNKDLPNAVIHQLEGGHFLLEEHSKTAAQIIKEFIER